MAARSIATLTVSFGLVSIPVKLYSATEASRAISFNLLHKACGSRLKQQYICVKEEVPVAREDMAKGYEFADDQYVMFSPEELKALEEAGTHTADIAEFVPIESIDPVYFDKAYYLAPDKGGAKPYALLAEALRKSNRCALGRWAARGKQYIVMIRPVEDGLVMQQLLYAGEVRSIKEIEIPKTEVKDAELKLAQQLIEQQASNKFDPSAYKDEVRDRIEAAVQKKVEGQEITMAEEPEGGAQVIDLMEALRASLEKKAPAKAEQEEARKPAKRAEQPAPAAQHHPQPDQVGLRLPRPRPAEVVSLLVPGSDRPSHRPGARHGEGAGETDHALAQGAAPPSSRGDAAVGTQHRRGGRARGRAGGRPALAGGLRPVFARVRRRSGRRFAERDRSQRRCSRGEHGRLVRPGMQSGERRRRSRAGGV